MLARFFGGTAVDTTGGTTAESPPLPPIHPGADAEAHLLCVPSIEDDYHLHGDCTVEVSEPLTRDFGTQTVPVNTGYVILVDGNPEQFILSKTLALERTNDLRRQYEMGSGMYSITNGNNISIFQNSRRIHTLAAVQLSVNSLNSLTDDPSFPDESIPPPPPGPRVKPPPPPGPPPPSSQDKTDGTTAAVRFPI